VASPSSAISLSGKLNESSPACIMLCGESMAGRDSLCQTKDGVLPVFWGMASLVVREHVLPKIINDPTTIDQRL